MTIVHCPRCGDEVTVPAKASPRALVRCPLCLDEYTLREALAELPPALIVIDGSVAEEAGELVGAGVAEGEVGGGYEMAGGGFPSSAAFDSSAPEGATIAPARPALRGKLRPKPKPKSAIAEMLKVVIGGVVGLSAGLLVLWWVFGKDPLDLGPQVSDYAPWAVPAKFQRKGGKLTADDKTAGVAPGNNTIASAGPNNPPSNNGKNKRAGQGLPVNPDLQAALDNKPAPMPEPLIGELDPLGNPIPATPVVPEIPSITPTPTPMPKPEPVSLPTPEPTPTPEPAPPVKQIPLPADFQSAVLAAADALTRANESTGKPAAERIQIFTDMHRAAAEMGRTISYQSPSDPDLYDSVSTMKTFFDSLISTGKVQAMKRITDTELPLRKNDEGMFLVGAVKDFQAVGSMFECEILSGQANAPVTVLSLNNPQDFCKVGDELLIVGRSIDNPKKNLPGYEGEQAKVVLYGFHHVVPKAP